MMRVDVHGARVLLANVDGEYYAVSDTCTHEDASLSQGALHGEYIRCPLHGSRFSLRTGDPLEEPAETPLKVYPVKLSNDDICIGPAIS